MIKHKMKIHAHYAIEKDAIKTVNKRLTGRSKLTLRISKLTSLLIFYKEFFPQW